MSKRINWGFVNYKKLNSYLTPKYRPQVKQLIKNHFKADKKAFEVANEIFTTSGRTISSAYEGELSNVVYVLIANLKDVGKYQSAKLASSSFYQSLSIIERHFPKSQAKLYLRSIARGINYGVDAAGKEIRTTNSNLFVCPPSWVAKFHDSIIKLMQQLERSQKKFTFSEWTSLHGFLEEMNSLLWQFCEQKKFDSFYILIA
jgi:hypothetical protein